MLDHCEPDGEPERVATECSKSAQKTRPATAPLTIGASTRWRANAGRGSRGTRAARCRSRGTRTPCGRRLDEPPDGGRRRTGERSLQPGVHRGASARSRSTATSSSSRRRSRRPAGDLGVTAAPPTTISSSPGPTVGAWRGAVDRLGPGGAEAEGRPAPNRLREGDGCIDGRVGAEKLHPPAVGAEHDGEHGRPDIVMLSRSAGEHRPPRARLPGPPRSASRDARAPWP